MIPAKPLIAVEGAGHDLDLKGRQAAELPRLIFLNSPFRELCSERRLLPEGLPERSRRAYAVCRQRGSPGTRGKKFRSG
jgi:hypothetical protein